MTRRASGAPAERADDLAWPLAAVAVEFERLVLATAELGAALAGLQARLQALDADTAQRETDAAAEAVDPPAPTSRPPWPAIGTLPPDALPPADAGDHAGPAIVREPGRVIHRMKG